MRILILLVGIFCFGANVFGQAKDITEWTKLVDQGEKKAAKDLCTSFVDSPLAWQQAEAQKCLANVALMGNSATMVEGDEAGGGNLHGGFTAEAADEAIKHLDLGIKAAPQDLSIHQGRLHILEVTGRYEEMVKALDESATIYTGKDGLDAWLAYAPELDEARQYTAGLKFMKVLDKHYPNNSDVIGNLGAFSEALKQYDEAIVYLKKAVEMAPEDSINAWDLGRAYDFGGHIEEADRWYQKGMSLERDTERRKDQSCLYAVFVEKKLKELPRACEMEKKSCGVEEQTACAGAEKPRGKK